MTKYGINIIDSEGNDYLLCKEGSDRFETFRSYEKADDYNYEFDASLPEGLRCDVVAVNG